MPATRRKKNPLAQRDAHPFPFMAPDYPVKPWVNPATQARFMTVSFRRDDGSFAAFIAEDESVWAAGRTRREAEERVVANYVSRVKIRAKNTREAAAEAEDEDDFRISEERLRGKFVDWRDVRHKYAR